MIPVVKATKKADDIKDFASLNAKIMHSDRWSLIVVSGDMGEGKSCFSDTAAAETAKFAGTPFSREANMTYLRKELKRFVDGDEHGAGKLPEYSVVHVDELISLFFKRNWFDAEQIDGIELLNKCRDRHLCIIGNIPNFWDLDSALYAMVTFWVHVDERGKAWVFQKSKNPFATDKWYKAYNEKRFEKDGNPYKCKGFITELNFPNWTPDDKRAYYRIRNAKRKNTEGQRSRLEKYGDVKRQRDEVIRFILHIANQHKLKDITHKTVAQLTGLERSMISYISRDVQQ